MSFVVIDKCWLQGFINTDKLQKLTSSHRVLIPDILMYEISTTEHEGVKFNCFKKLDSIKESIDFLPNSGFLIKSELSSQSSSPSIQEKLYPKTLYPIFLKNLFLLSNPKFKVSNFHNDLYYEQFEKKDVDYLKKIGSTISYYFPELQGIKGGTKKELVKKIKNELGQDKKKLKDLLKKFIQDSIKFCDNQVLPPVEKINENWVLFRYFQVYSIAWVDFIGKYGEGNINVNSSKFPNRCIDFEYCIAGLLSGAIATRDQLVEEIFEICCPEGVLYN